MPLEHTDSSTGQYDGAKHEKLDFEVREMFNAITSRIFRLHNTGGSSINPHQHHGDAEDDSGGIRVLTLAGNNTGATFRDGQEGKTVGNGPRIDEEEETLGTYVNSNFQAINNSIVMGGSYSANDPGVHADITDFVEHKQKHGKKDNKEKEKKKRSAESE